MAVAGTAADAPAPWPVPLVQHDAERRVERVEAEPGEVLAELLQPRLVADGGIPVGRAGRRLRRILTPRSVHLIQVLGFRVIGFQLVIADRPGRRHAAMMVQEAEILPAEAEE